MQDRLGAHQGEGEAVLLTMQVISNFWHKSVESYERMNQQTHNCMNEQLNKWMSEWMKYVIHQRF